MERQIVLDTETTGLDPAQGHRIIEIGCVELVNRKLTGNNFHVYINPQRDIDQGAIEVHGITNEFLADKPLFTDISSDLMNYLKGGELIIHNAAFDVGFLDAEYQKLDVMYSKINEACKVFDTLLHARKMFPGQRNDLDSLCRRYEIDNSHRELHGALLDAEILADVYLLMTGGQTSMLLDAFESDQQQENSEKKKPVLAGLTLPVVYPTSEEMENHVKWQKLLDDKVQGESLWTRLENTKRE